MKVIDKMTQPWICPYYSRLNQRFPNNMLERLNREIRRRTKVVGIFPNPDSYLRLVTVYLMEYSEDWSVTKAYLSETSLNSLGNQAA